MVSESLIDKYNLREEAIRLLTDLDTIHTAEDASDILSTKCGKYIPDTEYLAFRKDYLFEQKRRSLQPVPLSVPRAPSVVPQSLQELSAFSQIDVFRTICGVTHQSYQIYVQAMREGDLKAATQSLRLTMDSSDMIDKKIKAVGGKDSTSQILGDTVLQNFNYCLSELNLEHPEWRLLELLRDKLDEMRAKQAAFEITEET